MLKLVAFAKKNLSDIEIDLNDDKNRKKSANMILASKTAQDILMQAQHISGFSDSALDLIFCSGEGELDQTFEFYKNLAENRARPILFQNSLHNSTLGSLSLEIPHLSSGTTISNGDISFEMAIDVALSSHSSNPILIMGVDVYNKELKTIRYESYEKQADLTSGACAGLFIPETHPQFNTLKGYIVRDIKFDHQNHNQKFSNYFPSNGLKEIHEQLTKTNPSFSLRRPGGHLVTIYCHEN